MASLKQLLGEGDKRKAVIADALRVLDAEVSDKRGFTGLAIKTPYKIVKSIGPGFLRDAIDHLLDDFLDALDPIYQESLEQDRPPGSHFESKPGRVADSLLSITDRRAQRVDNRIIKKAYSGLRSQAKKHVEAAVPRLGELLERHTAT